MLIFPPSGKTDLVERILAVVNGKIITLSDLNTYRTFFGRNRDDETILEELIDQKLLLDEAEKFQFSDPPKEAIEAANQKKVIEFGNPQKLAEAREDHGITEEDLLGMIRSRLITAQLIDQRVNFFVFLSPRNIQDYYRDHASEYNGRPLVEVQSEIQDLLTRQKTEAKRKAYLNRLKRRATISIN